MYEDYARKIATKAGYKARAYQANSLNTTVLTLPFGEAHVALWNEGRWNNLPRMGEDFSVIAHAQLYFFDLIQSEAELHEFTSPFQIDKRFVEDMSLLDQWAGLERHLAQYELQPVIVFKNQATRFNDEPYYIADFRVLFFSERLFTWRG